MSRAKNAAIYAVTVEVTCRACGDAVPDPEQGSTFWTVEQVAQHGSAPRKCGSCDGMMVISLPSKVLAQSFDPEAV